MQEEFRKITGYVNYSVSNTGLVRNDTTQRILKPTINGCGYYTISLSKDRISKTHNVHKLIAEAFIANPDNKTCIDHINNDRSDNSINNLRWCSYQENNRNRSMRSDNTSGIKGISWNKKCGKWKAKIVVSGKDIHIDNFDSLEEAAAARLRVAEENFGDYINACERAPIINN